MKLTLRAHHLLCLKGFQGYGYDESFVKNMNEVNIKRKNNSTTITLISAADDLCVKCPNLKNNICQNKTENDKIILMDKEVLKRLDITKEYNSVELFEKIDEIFNTKESVCEICSSCMWHEKCLFYQNLSDDR